MKMVKEFNLSEKRFGEFIHPISSFYDEKDVKEFIKRLENNIYWALKHKAKYYELEDKENVKHFIKEWIKIDKLAGEKLYG